MSRTRAASRAATRAVNHLAFGVAVFGIAVVVFAGAAHAAPPTRSRAPTAADFAALKQRVDEQGELINKLTQLESDHYQMLVKLIQNLRPGSAPIVLPPSSAA